MNSSIHRIWSGSRTWRSATKIVEMRMKPRNATWVETTKTRPFWTLSTIRRPSARPYISVANESSPSTRSDASRATAVPLPIATATSAPWSAGRVVHPVAGDRHDPVVGARRAHEAQLLLRRRAGDDVQVGQLRGEPRRRPSRDLLAGDDRVGVEARLAGDRGGRPGVVAGDDDDLDPGAAGRRHRLGDPGPDRVGEADERAHLPRPVVDASSERDEPLARRRRRLDEVRPALALRRVGASRSST